MKMWGCDMDDPRITEMDPVRKLWMYHNWLGDHRDDAELAKNHAYLVGSFINPEAVQQMLGTNVHESSDKDFDESLKMVMEADVSKLEDSKATKRKRKRRATLKE
jgi:hypothetical protein